MAQILVRNIDSETVERLKLRAQRNGRSTQAEVKSVLERAAATLSMREASEQAREIRKRIEPRPEMDSALLIREDRNR